MATTKKPSIKKAGGANMGASAPYLAFCVP
jgi:hypothetical protein